METSFWSKYARAQTSRRSLLRAGGLGIAGAALAACGGKSNSNNKPSTAANSTSSNAGGAAPSAKSATAAAAGSATPKQGGTITYGNTNVAAWRQSDMDTALAGSIWHLIGKRALTLEGNTKKLLPETVAKWEIPGDGSEFLLHVQPNVQIQNKPPANGRTFTAEDLAFNIMRIAGKLDPQHLAQYQRASTMAGLDHAVAVDNLTCRVVMTRPSSTLLAGLTEIRNELMPKDVVLANQFNNIDALAGHGPFQTQKYTDGQSMTAVRFPNYFIKGQPHADGLQDIFLPDAATYLSAFVSGKIDMFAGASQQQMTAVKASRPDARFFTWPSLNWYHIRFQVQKPPFTDFRVRKAIFLALDYKAIGDGTWGSGWEYTGPLEPEHPEALTAAQIQQLPGYNPATKSQDRQTAKQMMSAAGHPEGDITFQIMPALPDPTSSYFENAIRVQAQLKTVWPKMNVTVTPPSDFAGFARLQAMNDFSTVSYTITSLPDAVLELDSQWHTPGGLDGSRNYGQFKNADADAMLDKAFTTLDNNARKSLLLDFQKKYFDQWMPAIQLHEGPDRYFVSPHLQGFDQVTGPWWYTGYRLYDRAGVLWKV